MKLKGFPTRIGKEIELPDMAELLLYQPFFDTCAEDVYKHGSEFQRYLLDQANFTNTKRIVSVMFQVRLLVPNTRSCTNIPDSKNIEEEWHIDCEDEDYSITEERDIVHILTNETTCMTEFNSEDMHLEFKGTTMLELNKYLIDNKDKYPIVPKKMPPNRIVTFSNHLHRATDTQRPEFRFMFRAVETNREPNFPYYDPRVHSVTQIFDGKTKSYMDQIKREKGKIIISLPSIDGKGFWRQS